jgi:hypothetical protein
MLADNGIVVTIEEEPQIVERLKECYGEKFQYEYRK